jgi:hypothetical protein
MKHSIGLQNKAFTCISLSENQSKLSAKRSLVSDENTKDESIHSEKGIGGLMIQ